MADVEEQPEVVVEVKYGCPLCGMKDNKHARLCFEFRQLVKRVTELESGSSEPKGADPDDDQD
jgi:hypothetical protein